MSKVIKGGTVVTADLTYEADVLIDGERIVAIGPDLRATRCWTPRAATSCRAASTRTPI